MIEEPADLTKCRVRGSTGQCSETSSPGSSRVPASSRVPGIVGAIALGAGAVWLVSAAVVDGFLPYCFPKTIEIGSGRLYVSMANTVDITASAMVLCLVTFIMSKRIVGEARVGFRQRRIIRVPHGIDPATGTGVPGPNHTHRWEESHYIGQVRKKEIRHISGNNIVRMCVSVVVLLVVIVIAYAMMPASTNQMIRSAVVVQRSGNTQAAFEALVQEMPTRYDANNYSFYFFASGWAQDLHKWRAAALLDVFLMRSSAQIGMLTGLATALVQYQYVMQRPIALTTRADLTNISSGKYWNECVATLIKWQQSGDSATAISTLINAERTANQQFSLQLRSTIRIVKTAALRAE